MPSLLEILGAANEAEGIAYARTATDTMVRLVKATNAANPQIAADTLIATANVAAQVCDALGVKDIKGAIGAIDGLKATAAKVDELNAKIEAKEKADREADAKSIIDDAVVAGSITRDDAQAYYATHGIDALRGLVAHLPKGPRPSPESPTQPESRGVRTVSGTNARAQVAKAMGKTVEFITQAESTFAFTGTHRYSNVPNSRCVIHDESMVEYDKHLVKTGAIEGFKPANETTINKIEAARFNASPLRQLADNIGMKRAR